jgi:hypothetical protein
LSPLTVERFISEGRSYLLKEEPVIKGEMTAVSMAKQWNGTLTRPLPSMIPSCIRLFTFSFTLQARYHWNFSQREAGYVLKYRITA